MKTMRAQRRQPVVEIVSPSTLKRDRLEKLHTYAKFAIPEYWIADPEAGYLEQYVLDDGRYSIRNIYQEDDPVTSERLACVSFTMNELLAGIPKIG
ncbi:MAG TPA: Uma2 family endonuclease [Bacilli bacterium]